VTKKQLEDYYDIKIIEQRGGSFNYLCKALTKQDEIIAFSYNLKILEEKIIKYFKNI